MTRTKILVAVCALVVVVGALPAAVASSGASSASSISVGADAAGDADGTVTVEPGETVTLTVWANAADVRGYQANLTFDSSVAEVESVAGGSDFDDPVVNVNNDEGWVAFNQIRSSETDDPVLAEVTVRITGGAGDSTALWFVEADTKFSDGDGEEFSPETYEAVELSVEESTPTPTATPTATETPTSTETSAPTEEPTATPTPTKEPSDDDTNAGGGDGSGGGGSSGGAATGRDDKEEATPAPEPSFSVEEATLNTSASVAGAPILLSATVANTGEASGVFDTRVYVDGNATETNRTVEVEVGQKRQVNLSLRFDSPGTYAVAVNDTTVGNVTVQATETANPSSTAATSPSTELASTTVPASETTDATPPSSPTETDTEAASAGRTTKSMPGFGFVLPLGTIAVLVGWMRVRRARMD